MQCVGAAEPKTQIDCMEKLSHDICRLRAAAMPDQAIVGVRCWNAAFIFAATGLSAYACLVAPFSIIFFYSSLNVGKRQCALTL